MEKNFEIVSFKMLKEIAENHRRAGVIYSPDEFIAERLRSLAGFFEANGLSTRKLLDSSGNIPEEFVLLSSDLTELGMRVLRKGYKAWMKDAQKRPPGDVSAMIRALKRESEIQ